MRPLVVALNPSIDAEWRVAAVRWEEKNNILSARRWAGGKGVNVVRWLKYLGARPQLILPLGGDSGRELAAMLRAEKIPATIIHLGASLSGRQRSISREGNNSATRVNVIVTSKAQGQLRFNPLGPELSRHEWQKILASIQASLPRASCLILSGSLPRGVPVNAYAQIIRLARARKIPALLDCDGPALAAAVLARPFLVKPNEHELAQWAVATGRRAGLRASALAMSRLTGGWVLVSRGAKPALLINAGQGFQLTATPPRVKPRNTVGAGDSLLAAVAHQLIQGASPEAWLRAGLAVGAAATQLQAGQLPA